MSKDIKLDELPSPQDLSADQLPSPSDLGAAPEAPKPDVSQVESLIRGGVQGATMGFSDEALGALQAAASPVQVLSADDKLGKLQELYKQYRDIERAKNKAAEDANPKTYLAGSVGGGIATLPAAGTLKGAMGLGALAGYGASESDSAAGDMGNAALGAGLGAVGHGVGKILGKALSPKALKDEAAQSAAFAAGVKGLPSSKQKVGEALLKSGALNETGVSEAGLGTIREASTEAEKNLQPMLEKAASKLQGMNPDEINTAVGGDAGDKVQQLLADTVDSIKDMSGDAQHEFYEKIAPKVQDYILKLKEAGSDPSRLNEIKRAAQQEAQDVWNEVIKYKRSQVPTPKNFEEWAKMADDIRDVIKGHIEQLGNLAEPGLGDAIRSNNYYAGGLAGATKALNSKLVKGDQGIKTSNPLEYAYHPKWALIKDAIKNLGSDGIALTKAKNMSNAADTLTKGFEAVGLNPETPSKAISTFASKSISSVPSQEAGQSLFAPRKEYVTPDTKDTAVNKPVAVSKDLYTRSDEDLKLIADMFSTEKGMEPYGSALNRALANKDIPAKNAALYVLATKPETRKLLIQRGLLAE